MLDKQKIEHRELISSGTAKSYYEREKSNRSQYETEWDDSCQLTLPYLSPNFRGEAMVTPYSSLGSSGVNSLSAKLLLTLLPPSGSFFRLLPDKDDTEDLKEEELSALDAELAELEEDVIEYIAQRGLRVGTIEGLKYLLVTGNACLYKIPEGGIKCFSPYQYVVNRDLEGEVLDACIFETKTIATLPDKVIIQLNNAVGESGHTPHEDLDGSYTKDSDVELEIYTRIVRLSIGKFKVWQEIDGVIIDGTIKKYTPDNLPYMFLRWITQDGVDYGIGHVTQYIGDLRSLEGLTKSVLEFAGMASFTLFGVRPNSMLSIKDINDAQNGEFLQGDLEKEISTLRVDKGADLAIPMQMMQSLEGRIGKAFLNLSGQIRDSERTTASEVRMVANELESTFGGSYSVLSSAFQVPLVSLILDELAPEALNISTPSVTAGLNAISRERDAQNYTSFLQSLASVPPEVLSENINWGKLINKMGVSLGLKSGEITYTPEELQQAKAQQAEQEAMQQGVQAGMAQQGQPPTQ